MRLVAAAVFGSFDQPVPVEHGIDRALGGDPRVPGQPPDQELSDLPRAPVRLLTLTVNNQPFYRGRELVGIAHWSARAVAECIRPKVLPMSPVQNVTYLSSRALEIRSACWPPANAIEVGADFRRNLYGALDGPP